MRQLFDLTGAVSLVTGGSRGLGRAIALGLAKAGADVVVASRSVSACAAVAKEIERSGRGALAVACDMASWEDIERLARATHDRFGRCDVLVNNAGVTQDPVPLVETSSEFFDHVCAVNLKGPMRLASLLAPRMGEAGGGSIVNVLSTAAVEPVAYMGAYTASKSALRALTRVMAEEWAPLGVRVNAIAPGLFRTDMIEELERSTPGFTEQAAANSILKRVAEPDEIVGAVLFLASNASSYVTAQTFGVCGGVL